MELNENEWLLSLFYLVPTIFNTDENGFLYKNSFINYIIICNLLKILQYFKFSITS